MRRFKPTKAQKRVLDRVPYSVQEVHSDGDLTISLGGPTGNLYVLDTAGGLYKYLSTEETDILIGRN